MALLRDTRSRALWGSGMAMPTMGGAVRMGEGGWVVVSGASHRRGTGEGRGGGRCEGGCWEGG